MIEQNIIKDSNYCSNSFTQLGYGLTTLNTLSQVTGYPIGRVSMHVRNNDTELFSPGVMFASEASLCNKAGDNSAELRGCNSVINIFQK